MHAVGATCSVILSLASTVTVLVPIPHTTLDSLSLCMHRTPSMLAIIDTEIRTLQWVKADCNAVLPVISIETTMNLRCR